MKMPAKIAITKDPQDPQPLEIMERAIVDVAEGARKLLGTRLNKRAVLTLLKDDTGLPKSTIERVLDSAAQLDKNFLKTAGGRGLGIGSLRLRVRAGQAQGPPRPLPGAADLGHR
jgi:hypothetical protein